MRAAEALARMRDLPVRAYPEAFAGRRLAILAPHPDDESLGCGGLIAEACRHGAPPLVVILTDGAGSHPRSREYPPDRLRTLREAELHAAVALLGLPENRTAFLRCPDTAAPASGPAFQQLATQLAAILRGQGCDTLLVTWRHDPHGDHAAAARIAARAAAIAGARLLAYPVWGLTLPADADLDDDSIDGFRLDITRHLARKRAAILAHRSQYAGLITDDPNGFQLDPGFIDRFLGGYETFLFTTAPHPAPAA
jgi:LmbE family N-acetylglucosaminyl deacetylase